MPQGTAQVTSEPLQAAAATLTAGRAEQGHLGRESRPWLGGYD